jgi:hypothetical protein
VPEESIHETSFPSGANSANRVPASASVPPPPQIDTVAPSDMQTPGMSSSMLIATTIAICLPIALLIGMILGYLIAIQQ